MSHWSCVWESCRQPATQGAGDCLLCDRHFCRTHRQQPWHKCPKPDVCCTPTQISTIVAMLTLIYQENWESYYTRFAAAEARHIDELCLRIDRSKLCSRASMLREGIPCTVDLSRKSLSAMMGNQNCHAVITFDDSVRWLARFRLIRTLSPPREVRD
jgi:hypothetical protein